MRNGIVWAATLVATSLPAVGYSQSLADRVARLPVNAAASFAFPARDGVCGGPGLVRFGSSIHVSAGSNWTGSSEDQPCAAGPVWVTLTRDGGQLIRLEVGVGGAPADRESTYLGEVSGVEAAGYLFHLAESSEGRPASSAIFPAILGRGSNPISGLTRLLQNQALSQQVRRSAATWLAREGESAGTAESDRVVTTLAGVARNADEAPALRQHALNLLARSGSAGVPMLIQFSENSDPWMARSATSALGSSDDPRGRGRLRALAQAEKLPDGVRAAALKGLGRSSATPVDLALLRDVFPKLTVASEQEAVISAIGAAGGKTNAHWLLELTEREDISETLISRAIRSAREAGIGSGDLAARYDRLRSRRPRTTVITELARIGDRVALDKLLSIARHDTDVALRRAAIQQLANSSDPEIRQALIQIADR